MVTMNITEEILFNYILTEYDVKKEDTIIGDKILVGLFTSSFPKSSHFNNRKIVPFRTINELKAGPNTEYFASIQPSVTKEGVFLANIVGKDELGNRYMRFITNDQDYVNTHTGAFKL